MTPLVVLGLCVGGWFGCLFMLWRNFRVRDFYENLINAVFDHDDWHWRLQELEKVSYNEMMFKFWRPLKPERWWDDVSFLSDAPRSSATMAE